MECRNKTNVFLFRLLCGIFLLGHVSSTEQGLEDDLLMDSSECQNPACGCISVYTYDERNNKCVIDYKRVIKRVVKFYNKQDVQFLPEDALAKSIYEEGEKIFKGILVAVFLFIICASTCVIIACIYCCRINYTDRTLNKDVKALAKKLNRNYNSKKMLPKPKSLPPISESCNVVVEDAGVFVA